MYGYTVYTVEDRVRIIDGAGKLVAEIDGGLAEARTWLDAHVEKLARDEQARFRIGSPVAEQPSVAEPTSKEEG